MTRSEQLADAYEEVAHADHYMVGIVESVTDDERDAAEQILITRQNSCAPDTSAWEVFELALDCLSQDRKAHYRAQIASQTL